MTLNKSRRIQSLDLLKGVAMVLMALDHTRDFFHDDAFLYFAEDPEASNLPVFFSRWITHFCAPAFCLLAGVSAYLVGRKKTKAELSVFLLKRGIWLVIVELTIVSFGWNFDIHFWYNELAVIWMLGMSMIVLAGLIHLPLNWVLIVSIVLIFGHNLLDNINFGDSIPLAILHEFAGFTILENRRLFISYPLIPWVAVMSFGYWFGRIYSQEAAHRKTVLIRLGGGCIAAFIVLRIAGVYGDPVPWIHYSDPAKSLMSFLALNKYPPSLLYLFMTLGPAFLVLAFTENAHGKVADFLKTFGRVPFFYYILHIYLIHLLAGFAALATGFGTDMFVLKNWITDVAILKGYGFDLWVVYLVWILIVLMLYPLCRRFDVYKQSHKEKKWLSYL